MDHMTELELEYGIIQPDITLKLSFILPDLESEISFEPCQIHLLPIWIDRNRLNSI